MKYLRFALLFVVFHTCFILNGDCQSVSDALAKYFSDYRENRLNTRSLSILDKVSDKSTILESFSPYLKDSLPSVRTEAYRLIGNLTSFENDKKVSSQVYIRKLLLGLTDNSSQVYNTIIGCFTKFNPTYFNSSDVNQILKAMRKAPDKSNFFRLAGYVGSKPVADTLKSYQPIISSKEEKWSLVLSLARLGDSTSIQTVSRIFDSSTKNTVEFLKLLPDFSYVKNKHIIDKMVEVVSEDKLECRSQNPSSSELIPCSYYVIPYLYYSITNFPVEVDEFGEIIDDYKDALVKIREWKISKGKTYLIQIYSYR